MREKSRLDNFKAYCNGTAYQYPDWAIYLDKIRTVKLFIGSVYLACFRFKTDSAYKIAVQEANKSIKISASYNLTP